MAELRPCPFCGGEATIVPHEFYSAVTNSFKVESYGVPCKNAGLLGINFSAARNTQLTHGTGG